VELAMLREAQLNASIKADAIAGSGGHKTRGFHPPNLRTLHQESIDADQSLERQRTSPDASAGREAQSL